MLQIDDDTHGWFENQLDFEDFFFFNRKIYLFLLTASRLSGIVCIVIANILAINTHKKISLFYKIPLCLFPLRKFVRLYHNRSFLLFFARFVLRLSTVMSVLYYSGVFLAGNVCWLIGVSQV